MSVFIGVVFITGGLYFNELFGFLLIHAYTLGIKKHTSDYDDKKPKKTAKVLLLIGIIGWVVGAVGLNVLGTRIGFIGEKF